MRGIYISKDGNGGAGFEWCVWAIDENGKRTLLSPQRTVEVKEPQVVEVMRINAQTKKPQKEKRHMDVVVGTKVERGEGQASALARYLAEGRAMVDKQLNERKAS